MSMHIAIFIKTKLEAMTSVHFVVAVAKMKKCGIVLGRKTTKLNGNCLQSTQNVKSKRYRTTKYKINLVLVTFRMAVKSQFFWMKTLLNCNQFSIISSHEFHENQISRSFLETMWKHRQPKNNNWNFLTKWWYLASYWKRFSYNILLLQSQKWRNVGLCSVVKLQN